MKISFVKDQKQRGRKDKGRDIKKDSKCERHTREMVFKKKKKTRKEKEREEGPWKIKMEWREEKLTEGNIGEQARARKRRKETKKAALKLLLGPAGSWQEGICSQSDILSRTGS